MGDPEGELLAIPKEYGAPSETLGWAQVRGRLEEALRYWLATTRVDGRPHVVPIDGLWIGDALWFGGSPATVWRSNLIADGRACLHLPDPDAAVIVEGVCEVVVPDASFVDELVQGSKQKYGFSVPASAYAGGVWRLQPRKAMAWSSLPSDATRFRFSAP
jgi:hypothetical protein